MTFLNFLQLPESIFRLNKRKIFFWKPSQVFLTGKCFLLTEKYFLLINFSNDKQIQEDLESDFSKTFFLRNKHTPSL